MFGLKPNEGKPVFWPCSEKQKVSFIASPFQQERLVVYQLHVHDTSLQMPVPPSSAGTRYFLSLLWQEPNDSTPSWCRKHVSSLCQCRNPMVPLPAGAETRCLLFQEVQESDVSSSYWCRSQMSPFPVSVGTQCLLLAREPDVHSSAGTKCLLFLPVDMCN